MRFFELFGFDFMVDDMGQVILIEVNSGPALARHGHVLEEMMHQFGDARNGQRSILYSNMAEVPEFPEQNQL